MLRMAEATASFNPRSRTGSDLWVYQVIAWTDEFQSTLPHGERQVSQEVLRLHLDVSIHAPARGATQRAATLNLPHKGFNPRSRTGSDFSDTRYTISLSEFQSTLPHGERHPLVLASLDDQIVSIHAPARGATIEEIRNRTNAWVSIHAPARGATCLRWVDTPNFSLRFNPRSRTGSDRVLYNLSDLMGGFQSTLPHGERPRLTRPLTFWPKRFNPRSRTGSDQIEPTLGVLGIAVSIHAPARGATTAVSPDTSPPQSFNPRSRTGSDIAQVCPCCSARQRFNPRSRTGSDEDNVGAIGRAVIVSIHAPARGATCVSATMAMARLSFNPRSRTGSDLVWYAAAWIAKSFNPRSRTGSDVDISHHPLNVSRFNPRSRTGSDEVLCRIFPLLRLFQSTLPHGERLGDADMVNLAFPFQSTLPHGERLLRIPSEEVRGGVSIHAPARGATRPSIQCSTTCRVSIHAPARGATRHRRWSADGTATVSIHAPARGATRTM